MTGRLKRAVYGGDPLMQGPPSESLRAYGGSDGGGGGPR
jgi:hypothetical protein